MRRSTLVLCLVALVACPSCKQEDRMDVPDGFVEVGREARGDYETRAVSADGVVVALRVEPNPENGAPEFWADAVRNELTQARGYALAKEEEVKSASGLDGRLMEFTADAEGVKAAYLVAVFVKDDDVLVAEAGGKADAVAARRDALRTALLSVR